MTGTVLHAGPEKTFVIVYQTGDEVLEGLRWFARGYKPRSASFTAIGAFKEAVLAYFDWETKAYLDIPVGEQAEVLMLAGDIAWKDDGEPVIHAHAVLGRSDGSTRGGHLRRAVVRPTLEMVLVEYPKHLERKHDPATGLTLIQV